MEHKAETSTDIISIVSEPGAMVFATRKEWRELPEVCLNELQQHEAVTVFKGTSGVFFLMRNNSPDQIFKDDGNAFRLVKITVDEETGKQIIFIMNLSRAEAAQLMHNRLTLWE